MQMPINFGTASFYRQLLIFLFLISSANAKAGVIFINEFHYDNAGADIHENIEIAMPEDTDTSDLLLRLYNGASQQKYKDISLSSYGITKASAGIGFITVMLSDIGASLQNGAPDGFALFDRGNLLQFISYEGSFSVTDDLLTNVTSVDIGVSESSATPVGQSISLIGNGSRYEDFTWQANIVSSFGKINPEQFFTQVNEPSNIALLMIALAMLAHFKKVKKSVPRRNYSINDEQY